MLTVTTRSTSLSAFACAAGFVCMTTLAACSGASIGAATTTPATAPTSALPQSTSNPPASSSSATVTGPPATTQDFASPDEVIAALTTAGTSCANPSAVELGPSDTYLAAASTCSVGSEEVVVASFETPDQRQQYLAIGLAGTGAYPHFVMGTTWAIATFTASTAEIIATAIGGKVY